MEKGKKGCAPDISSNPFEDHDPNGCITIDTLNEDAMQMKVAFIKRYHCRNHTG